jgi:hypothetical protein
MDPFIVLIIIAGIVGPVLLFLLKLCLFTVAASVVASAISPTVVIKKGDKDGDA